MVGMKTCTEKCCEYVIIINNFVFRFMALSCVAEGKGGIAFKVIRSKMRKRGKIRNEC
jgi:hypothetical protein